jgi:hypothetical protein
VALVLSVALLCRIISEKKSIQPLAASFKMNLSVIMKTENKRSLLLNMSAWKGLTSVSELDLEM